MVRWRVCRALRPPAELILALTLVLASSAAAYDPDIHVEISLDGVKLFNACLDRGSEEGRIDPETAKRFATKSRREDAISIWRARNWHFYDGRGYGSSSVWWAETFLDRIYTRRIQELQEEIAGRGGIEAAYTESGRVAHYVQDMGVPAHMFPIYHAAWPFGKLDPFDGYTLPEADKRIPSPTAERCAALSGEALDPWQILRGNFDATSRAIAERVEVSGSQPPAVSWADFWRSEGCGPKTLKGFGCYGEYTFGTPVELTGHDGPHRIEAATYQDFFDRRYRATVEATARVLYFVRRGGQP